ncbi:MAG: hypothetical protein KF787_02095 [Phycisphaeraceae bacterium]|nr:hypothetical protein [Phycisphaerae bacterium]MBX3391416.1 hypothetical protein [Phycisphaeraceae bacterium]
MPDYLITILDAAMLVHLLLLVVCMARLFRSPVAFDRLLAVDLIGTLLLATVVLLAIRERVSLVLDVALGLAAVGFMGSILLAKYVAVEMLDSDDRGPDEEPESGRGDSDAGRESRP